MPTEPQPSSSEREQTDKSLRTEREKADGSVGAGHAAVDQIANAVIAKARIPANERRATDKNLSSERAHADDALAARDEFLHIVSHELRNMLGAVIGFAELISQEAESAKVLGHAREIFLFGNRMNRLVGDLVDVASIKAGRLTVSSDTADAAAVATEAVEAFREQALHAGVRLTLELAPEVPKAEFDTARILQVLVNLLSNALKFTPAGGSVAVQVGPIDSGLQFSVRDTGIGVPRAHLAAIFERYLQVSEHDRRGVGLGLYICKSIIQGHGGRIWVESVEGKGSTFFFTLPAAG